MDTSPLWQPSVERIANAQITRFMDWLRSSCGRTFQDYDSLWSWSVEQPEGFWAAVWTYFDIPARKPYRQVLTGSAMPAVRWFEGSELNYVDQIFRHRNSRNPAIVFESESTGCGEISWEDLYSQVGALAHSLRKLGVTPGDRVVGYLPNIPQTVIAFLATASLGAIWSVTAPDMGPIGVLDRFKQIRPKIMIACDGYRFAGKPYDRRDAVKSITSQLPSLEALIWVHHLFGPDQPPITLDKPSHSWRDVMVAKTFAPHPVAVPASHPLWILYTSGTTGVPKAIVHGHAGMLVTALMTTQFHGNLHAGDKVFWTSSTSWMVWNAHVSCLLSGATIFLFDGSPGGCSGQADWNTLWRIAEREKFTHFGAGAAFYHACMKADVRPRDSMDLSTITVATSTGSPLSVEGYRWLSTSINEDLWISSTSGGTDICGAFVGGLPTLPVYAGEIQCRVLGAAVASFDDDGHSVVDEVGELVCTAAMPSMPLFLWGDEHNLQYQESYFKGFDQLHALPVWRHGDWIKLVRRPNAVGAIIYGRSDATINRNGVRMGTAELYRAVEKFDEIVDSMVVDLEYLGRESYMALFIVLRDSSVLTPNLTAKLIDAIRSALSPRHVPDEIVAVPAIPKTLTGKKIEVPIKRLLLGHPPARVISPYALANPESLNWYIEFAHQRASRHGLIG